MTPKARSKNNAPPQQEKRRPGAGTRIHQGAATTKEGRWAVLPAGRRSSTGQAPVRPPIRIKKASNVRTGPTRAPLPWSSPAGCLASRPSAIAAGTPTSRTPKRRPTAIGLFAHNPDRDWIRPAAAPGQATPSAGSIAPPGLPSGRPFHLAFISGTPASARTCACSPRPSACSSSCAAPAAPSGRPCGSSTRAIFPPKFCCRGARNCSS